MKHTEPMDVAIEELYEILERLKPYLSEEELAKFQGAFRTLNMLTESLEDRRTTLKKLRAMLFGATSEKIDKVFKKNASLPADASPEQKERKQKPKGHGRNGADSYAGAKKIDVPHPDLKAKDPCPECVDGTIYPLPAAPVVRVRGQAPLDVTVYRKERFRCNLCGVTFTAPNPADVGPAKYDATAGSMIALLKYGNGVPFNRLANLQSDLQAMLPSSTQWDIVAGVKKVCLPAFEELIRQAAQGSVVHNDDTGMKILERMKDLQQQKAAGQPADRTGTFTTGIVSVQGARRIGLFFTGGRHAGENLETVLSHRAGSDPPLQMCDGLARNLPKELKTVVSNCLAHGRRYFVDLAEPFPKEVEHVLTELGKVYHYERLARKEGMSPEERLRFHKEKSAPVMANLEQWLRALIDEKAVEPNSALGKAIMYVLKRWKKMTLFLIRPGAPLDNNLCERMLKKAIRHRKNSLFYKTQNGARTGDVFMSLIATCQYAKVNPFEYLTALQRHAKAVQTQPAQWMPWNYTKAQPSN